MIYSLDLMRRIVFLPSNLVRRSRDGRSGLYHEVRAAAHVRSQSWGWGRCFGEEFLTRFGLKRSGGVGDPYRELHEVGEAAGWANGGGLLLHFKAIGSGLLQPPSIQAEGLGSIRGLGQCSLSRRRSSSGFKSCRQQRRLLLHDLRQCRAAPSVHLQLQE
jgi:hypothetical protein